MTPMDITCNCSSVKIRIRAPAVQAFYCHCDDCQKATGAPFVMVSIFPASVVEIEGETDAWTLREMPRHRCRRCGTQLLGIPDEEQIGIRGERLPPGAFKPEFHIHCRHAHLPVQDALPHYASLPAVFGGDDARVAW